MNSFILRPIKHKDYEELHSLVRRMKDGLPSLPDDKKILKGKIAASIDAFNKEINKPKNELYLFVLEDLQSNKLAGISGIDAKCGGNDGFYYFAIKEEKFVENSLDISKRIHVLHLKQNKKICSELCSLYLSSDYRKMGLAKLLAYGRYLYIKLNAGRFSDTIIASLRGFRDKEGRSPFWRTIGKNFFEHSLKTADIMKSLGNKGFIRKLMPKYPIYIPLLDKEAQDCIGKLHKRTAPAYGLLTEQGFKYKQWVDIFDAGPYMVAKKTNIKFIKKSKIYTVESTTKKKLKGPLHLISNTKEKFIATTSMVKVSSRGKATISEETAKTLKIKAGDQILASEA